MAELVLVVEDEARVRELVSYTLQGAGYRVVIVDDGESALREIGQATPNLIVLDVRLPGIDGWEVCPWSSSTAAGFGPPFVSRCGW